MKRCQKCNQIYNDDDLNFCLSDGELLVSAPDSEETVIRSSPFLPQPSPSVRRDFNPIFAYLAIGLLVLFAGIVTFTAVYYYSAKQVAQEISLANSKSNSLVTNTNDSNQQKTKIASSSKTLSEVIDKLNLSTINFRSARSEIPSDAEPFLQEIAARLKHVSGSSVIEIGGHTDNVGNPAANQELSEARANSIRKKLIEYGVNPDMLIAKGYGGSSPKADNSTVEGRTINRRIEYIVVRQ